MGDLPYVSWRKQLESEFFCFCFYPQHIQMKIYQWIQEPWTDIQSPR
jgi:hypothetical protein